MRKEETLFRKSKVIPFLLKLRNTAFFPIQQLAIAGDPDFILNCRGRFVALELKRKGEVPRPLQLKKLTWVQKCGGIAIVATPANWAQVSHVLGLLDQGRYEDGSEDEVRGDHE